MTDGHPSPLRRVPVSNRGRQRVAQLLDAAAALFAEQGFETTSTNHIAKRAGVSIGSLYQYFPDKDAILQALAARQFDNLEATLVERLHILPDDTLQRFFARILDVLIDFYVHNPAFHPIFHGSYANAALEAASTGLYDNMVSHTDKTLSAFLPTMPTAARSLAADILTATTKAHLARAGTLDDAARTQWFDEVKHMVGAYLDALSRQYA